MDDSHSLCYMKRLCAVQGRGGVWCSGGGMVKGG